ncbi:MAG TPA: 2-oxoacid:acceptor oxidoreductase subunit alpha [Vicinamibacteria bacterium]|nr:2-oxoacid:acceptor oxidoreductase subunit alpha [Vicinamibacteria bacterium]
MSTEALVREKRERHIQPEAIVNDFSIQVATINGSGSQSSNNVLMRSIFRMGVPVSGKNLFPSNIAGLPTWFTIRASKQGYIARRKEVDFLVAMNPQTAREDVESLRPGAAVVYEQSLKLDGLRKDLVFYPVPFAELAKQVTEEVKLRKLLANMIYVGVVGQLLSIDKEEIKKSVVKQFQSKAKAIALNQKAIDLGFEYAEQSLTKADPLRVEHMDKTQGKVLIDGNAAGALGAMFGGVTVVTWYPITPSSSLCEQLIEYMKAYRVDKETGKATYAIVQAEDELAAIGMALGAGWAGARSMTSTSGPGISLMSEFVGLGYYAEIPAVIWNIQRVGPSTGLPTRTSQGDILFTYLLSHGDTKHLCLLPASVDECFEFGMEAFNLAERFQTPVFVLSDLDLGMNYWMADPFPYPQKPFDRGKVLTAEDLEKLGSFARYRDVDGDGIPYRTLPGTEHPAAAYFTRGSGHSENAEYTERPDDYQNNMDRLARKFETARKHVPQPVLEEEPDAEVGIIAFGSSHWAVTEARDQLKLEKNLKARYLRLRALPLTETLHSFVRSCQRVYVVEQNRDAQMAQLIRLELSQQPGQQDKIRSVLHYDGLPIDARSVADEIVALEKKASRKTEES